MKKIDLHLHTIPTVSDADFTFDLGTLQRYVSEAALDAIAITNHNLFSGAQFLAIEEAVDAVVFPGIEVTLDCGHVLIVANRADLDDFKEQAAKVEAQIVRPGDCITTSELLSLFPRLDEYLVIPHYDKAPAIRGEALQFLGKYVSAGEVDSAKKFVRAIRDEEKVTPVLFSDARISDGLMALPTRQTFVDCGDVTLSALKTCLRDKNKVALSLSEGNKLFQVFDNGQELSTGLNVLLGARSSGKTYTLEKINSSHVCVKYIKQFSLVQHDEASDVRQFNTDVERKRGHFVEDYLDGFKRVLNDVASVDLRADDREVENYLSSLIESAEAANRRDAFSNTALFGESAFSLSDDESLDDLIKSVRQVIENIQYRPLIEQYVDRGSLKRLAVQLIELLWSKSLGTKKRKFVNELVDDVKVKLSLRTSAVRVADVDLYQVMMNRHRVARFCEIVKNLQKCGVMSENEIQGFRVVATKGPFEGAGEIRAVSGSNAAFSGCFAHYDDPYEYMRSLLENDRVARADLHRLFVKIGYEILNRDGYPVSGGERSEFRLLQEIKDAQNYDMLLVDEPESSFDNMFLRSDVNQLIREISQNMPVVVVTHNNTVGASCGADYMLYASKEVEAGGVVYRVYAGRPTDLTLRAPDGKEIGNHEITLNTLEAGASAYEARRRGYEAIKD